MRWILWGGTRRAPGGVLDELGRIVSRDRLLERWSMTGIGVAATAHYLPERWMTAAEVGEASGIRGGRDRREVRPPREARRRRGRARERPRGRAGEPAPRRARRRPGAIGAVLYYGSTWKDYAVWQAAPWIAHRLGCTSAYAVEYDKVSMGTPVALRLATRSSPRRRSAPVLVVAACRESYLLDYGNERSRFMFNFGDGAVAGLLDEGGRPQPPPRLAHADRRLLLAAGEGARGGSVEPASPERRRPPSSTSPTPRR